MATKTKKKTAKKVKRTNGFALGDFVVYPTHCVRLITGIAAQEIIRMQLTLFIVDLAP